MIGEAYAKAQRGKERQEYLTQRREERQAQELFSLAFFASLREILSSSATRHASEDADSAAGHTPAAAQDKNPVPHSTTRHPPRATRHAPLTTEYWPLFTILLAFLLLGLAYSAVNPLHEATDELRHYRFIQHLIQRRALPVQGETGGLACTIQGHHPPLFYATAALATFWIDTGRDVCHEPPTNPFWAYRYWEVGRDNKNQYLHGADEAFPWRGEALAAHLARVVNLLFGALTVWLTWATARLMWPERPALAAGSAAFVAFNPMFLYMAAAINNDVAAAAAGAAITYACVRLLLDGRGLRWQWGVALGLLYAIALMSKFNLAAILVVIEAAVTWVAWRRGQWRQWLVVNALIAGVAALLAGWWFARNQMLYGEPTGIEQLTQLWGVRDPRDSFGLALSELPYAWTSLWGRFGYGQIPLPGGVYGVIFVVLLVSGGGYLYAFLKKRRRSVDRTMVRSTLPLLLLVLNVAIFFAVLFNYLLVSPAGPMGRFFFPALPALGILMFYGLTLWGKVPGARGQGIGEETSSLAPGPWNLEPVLTWAVNLGLVALSLIALFGFLAPAYARPAAWGEGDALPNPVDIQFDTLVALRGYAFDPATVRPGEPIDIELYWEVTGQPPGDYLLFVHLVDADTGALVAQRDTHPGLGNFPSSQWRPGDRFVERLSLYVPETAYVPAAAELRVGLYAPGGFRLGLTDTATGAGLGDSYTLGPVALAPAGPAAAQPNAGAYRFEDRINLVGYSYDRRVLAPDEPLVVSLYWEAQGAGMDAFDLQLRLLDEAGNVVAALQTPLADMPPGGVVAETYTIPPDPNRPPGSYRVQVSLEERATERRLQLVAEDGRWLDDKLILSAVRVGP